MQIWSCCGAVHCMVPLTCALCVKFNLMIVCVSHETFPALMAMILLLACDWAFP